MGTYNVSKIEGWLKDFTSAKDKFTNTYYGDFKKSYIRSCNDSVVVKMRNKLDEHYARISRINSRVKNVWDDFLWDLKTIDNRLAGGKGSTNNSSIGSKLAKLPSLKEYKANLNVRINSISAAVGTVNALGWADDKSFLENLANSSEILNSTAAVTATSVISGVFKLGEKLVDGAVWLGTAAVTGVATHIGFEEWANDKQNEVMDFIAFDFVGKANEILYKNTSIGRNYNDKSLIKYDSNIAQSIQNTTTKVTEFAVATGLTVATGGMAAPLSALIVAGTGFVIGAGDKAEEDFSKEDRSFWGDSKEISIAGGIKAIEFYSEGQMGAGMIKAAGSIISSGGVKNLIGGIKTVLSNGESSLFTKESLKNGLKATFKDVDTYMDSIGAAFNNISYNNKDGVQVNWKGLAKETACNFAMNSVFGFIGNAFETKMTTGMKNTIEGVNPKNAEVSSDVKKINVNDDLDDLRKEYDELLNKTKEPWFIETKKAEDSKYAVAWDLEKIKEVDYIEKRIRDLESAGVHESKIYAYAGAEKSLKQDLSKIENPINLKNTDINGNIVKNVETSLPVYKSFQTVNGIGIKISRKNDVLTLAPLGVTKIDDKIVYILLYNGKTIYSGTDVISQYINGNESLKKSIVDNFLNESRINKYLMTTDGYIGHFEIENGEMKNKIFRNFELKINEKANSYGTYLDEVRNFNKKANFGADQHTAYNYISKIDSAGVHVFDNNRQAVKNTLRDLKSKYNIDTNSLCNIIYYMDGNGAGACSYASRANAIFSKYRGKEADFMRDFGYPMYEKINGQVALNSRTLVTDLYISSNLNRNIPDKISLFKTGIDGKIEVNPKLSDGKFRKKNQVYMSTSLGINDDDMNLFFKRNGLGISHSSKRVSLNSIKSELIKDNQVQLGIYQNEKAPITLHNLDGGKNTITSSWNEGGGHALQVVGIQGDDIIVSSWGHKYSIKTSDLKSKNYVVYSTSIK